MLTESKSRLPRIGLSLTTEAVVRNILLVGFFVLLFLVGILGYWSARSFATLERDVAKLHAAEANHLHTILKVAETEGRLVTVARTLLAYDEGSMLHGAAKRNLKDIRNEMQDHIKEAHKSNLGNSEEWKEFEAAFEGYWQAVTTQGAPNWVDARERMSNAIAGLERLAGEEREANDRIARGLSEGARRKVAFATGSVLLVGLIVAWLAFYEIRRILNQLARAYRESAESRDYLRSLLDSLVSGVIVVNKDGIVRTVSESFRPLTGQGIESAVGQSYEQLFNEKPLLVEAIQKDLENQSPSGRYYGRVELGESRLFDVFASPLIIAGEHRGLILVFVDITETERAQAELRRNRALTAVGQMTAQIAHEIKNPLGSIRFAAEILKRQRPNVEPTEEEMIQVIERSVSHLASIVSELSEFARPKELTRTDVDLNKLLDDLIPMAADRLNAKGMVIEKEFAHDLPHGQYDSTELRKLFLNLIINAIDASEAGGSLELRTRLDGGRTVMVDVIDKGAGMDKETLRRLFEPFYTTKQTGTGLGMAIAKKIAELHRGDLIVSSRKGVGTTVTVRLPLE